MRGAQISIAVGLAKNPRINNPGGTFIWLIYIFVPE